MKNLFFLLQPVRKFCLNFKAFQISYFGTFQSKKKMYVLQFFKRFASFHIFVLYNKNVLAAQSIHQKVVISTFKLHVACSVGTYLVFLKVFIHSLIILFIGLNEILSWIRNSCRKSSHRMVKNGNMKKQRSCQKSFGGTRT